MARAFFAHAKPDVRPALFGGRGSVVALPLGASLELANRSKTRPLRYLIIKART